MVSGQTGWRWLTFPLLAFRGLSAIRAYRSAHWDIRLLHRCWRWSQPEKIQAHCQETYSKDMICFCNIQLQNVLWTVRGGGGGGGSPLKKATQFLVRSYLLSWNPLGNWVILIFSGRKPCTRIISSILHSFSHFSRAINVLSCRNEKERTSKKQ